VLLSPLLASALERGLNLAEAMEARGYGRPGRTSIVRPRWRARDSVLVAVAVVIVTAGALWL
jgi:energy-coupling factor transporter transmembrane protein EcfT